jgi:hypothetical protein
MTAGDGPADMSSGEKRDVVLAEKVVDGRRVAVPVSEP